MYPISDASHFGSSCSSTRDTRRAVARSASPSMACKLRPASRLGSATFDASVRGDMPQRSWNIIETDSRFALWPILCVRARRSGLARHSVVYCRATA